MVLGTLSTAGAKVVLTGNPTRTSGFFYDTHHSQRDRWHTMHVSCLDVPRAQGHIDDIRSKYGEDSNLWRVRVLGEFPKADDDTVIPLELVLSAVNRDVAPLTNYIPIWGLDVARFGDDSSALAKRQANRLLEPVKRWHNKDSIQLAALVEQEYLATPYDLKPHVILIDIIGLGAGVYDQCKARGLPVRGINVGTAAPTRENCMRLRDELWFKGREWFSDRACSIPEDDTLIAELVSPTYSYTATGKIVVEAKSDMKKRGLPSPDAADAFLLTFANRDKTKTSRSYRHETPESAWGV